MSPDARLKLILVGDAAVGKSSLSQQFTGSRYRGPTQGMEFATKRVQVGRCRLQVQIWDMGGTEIGVPPSYAQHAVGAIFVYDRSRRNTFLHLQQWFAALQPMAHPHLIQVLVGNKNDRPSQVSTREAMRFAQNHNMVFLYV